MLNEMEYFDFSKKPGRTATNDCNMNTEKPLISIITAYYNSKEYFEETYNSVINQTFPYWEWIIVNDGSTNDGEKEFLEEIAKKDSRIRLYHKENEGRLIARDYAIEKANCELLFILDSDDLIEKTLLECGYWSMITNPEATWCYTNQVGFGKMEYLWNKEYDFEIEKEENTICGNSIIKKSKIIEVGGYSATDEGVHEDWHLWLRFLAKGYFPIRLAFYGFWYRRREGVLSNIDKKNDTRKYAQKIIKSLAKKIPNRVDAIQFPTDSIDLDFSSYPCTFNWDRRDVKQNGKKKILFILPWFVVGGADKFNYDLIFRMSKENFEIHIITTEYTKYIWRQKFEEASDAVFDLTTFLNKKDWAGFIDYYIKSKGIELVFLSNSQYGYDILPWLKSQFPDIPMVDYIHAEDWSWRNGGYPRNSVAASRLLDKTYTCTENVKNIMYDKMNRNAHNVETVYIGVDEKNFAPDKVAVEEKLAVKYKDKKIILFACRITYLKRPLFIVELAKLMAQNREDLIFFIVGDGDALEHMQSQVEKYELGGYFVFFGMQEDLRKYYKMADVTLITSLTEGLTLTAYESLAMGTPVVSADVGGQKELVDEKCGAIIKRYQNVENDLYNYNYSEDELFEYEREITKILDNKDYASTANYCRERILNRFTVDKMAQTLMNNMNNIISSGTSVSKELCENKELSEMFLVLSNQINTRIYETYKFKHTFKDRAKRRLKRITRKLWEFRLYRLFIRVLQKTGVIALKKKIINKNIE